MGLPLARGDARGAQKVLGEAVHAAEISREWETHALAFAARALAHQSMGAEIHARRDREKALEILEATATILPPDLRSAFWSVPQRVALRAGNSEISVGDARVAPSGSSFLSVAPTVIAQDQRLVLLLELSRRIGEEKTLQRVLDQAVRSAVELTNAERGAILLVGHDGSLAVRARSGDGREDGPDDSFSRSIAETVLIDGEVVATHNARGDSRFADFRSVHELAITAVAAVPIRARARTLGVLYVENRRRRTVWSAPDLALMKAFAEQAGIAVEHARLVEELEARTVELEQAKRDIELLLQARTAELESTRVSLARAQEALTNRFAPQGMVANTEAMRKVFAIIDRVRDTDVPVVIEGESGTGKELIARAIHFSGSRQKGPFVVLHCGAIPETLLESELFGHVKGAFTGADRDRKGLLASANGGTVMLDEVADMPLKMQVELLRVLQERRVRPVGGEREESVDVRYVVATNRALKDLVQEGRFREDLFYRLSVVTIRLPPLRARIDDIPALASHFLARIAEEHGVTRRRLSREALHKLLRAPWPGNVRQLRHVLESAAVLSEADVIDADQLAIDEPSPGASPPAASGSIPPAASPLAVRRAAERQRILEALEQANWNKVRAATVLGMPRRTLYRRLREFGLLDE
jgi:transcriptional regulator with GAF, ATPase, and Fis domain